MIKTKRVAMNNYRQTSCGFGFDREIIISFHQYIDYKKVKPEIESVKLPEEKSGKTRKCAERVFPRSDS